MLTAANTDLHIIVTRDGLILVRDAAGKTVRDFQDRYPGFMTSFGPLDRNGVLDTFENEWPDLLVMNHDAIRTFTSATDAEGAAVPGQDKRWELRIVMNGGPP